MMIDQDGVRIVTSILLDEIFSVLCVVFYCPRVGLSVILGTLSADIQYSFLSFLTHHPPITLHPTTTTTTTTTTTLTLPPPAHHPPSPTLNLGNHPLIGKGSHRRE